MPTHKKLDSRKFAGFTLMELLLVIAIMGVLTTMALAMLRSANESARVSATQARISRIEAILTSELERYEVRRLPLSNNELRAFVQENRSPFLRTDGSQDMVQVRNLRRRILQEIIDIEMPRPFWKDDDPLTGEPIFECNRNFFPTVFFPAEYVPIRHDATLNSFPQYSLSFGNWLDANYPRPVGTTTLRQRLGQNPPAQVYAEANTLFDLPGEYLYQILARIDMDGTPALETLGSSSFGDTDPVGSVYDGFPEVLDAWGEPLQFLILQTDANETAEKKEDWDDVVDDIDWTNLNGPSTDPLIRGLPAGIKRLNPNIPRDLQQIHIRVFSKRLGLAK